MRRYLDLNDRAFNAIQARRKRVEIRANTKNHDYSKYEVGDVIVFKNSKSNTINCKITEINKYESVEELLMLEGTKYTLSSTNNYEEGIKSINSLNGYEKSIKENGVYAIHIEYLYSNENIWDELYNKAVEKQKLCDISNEFFDAGGVSSAILTKNGNIYTGVCIDTSCSLGMCEERNAISTMITNGEFQIEKVVCIGSSGNCMMPCGACMEYMMQLSSESENIEILKDLEAKETVKLKELIPVWWGKEKQISK